MLVCLLPLLVQAQVAPADTVPEIAASTWFNVPDYRLHDDRDVILFFFEARDRVSAGLVSRLNRIHRRPDVLVIGLTRDSRQAAADFIRRHRVIFTVGAQSRSAREFRITSLPALIHVSGAERAKCEALDPEGLTEWVSDWGPYGEESVDKINEPWELTALVESDAYGRSRRDGVLKLYGMLDAESFDALVKRQLPGEGDPWVRSALEFLRNRPTPEEISYQRTRSAAVESVQAYRTDADAPEFAQARRYAGERPVRDRPVAQLIRDYWEHTGDDASDAVIRNWIAKALNADHGEHRAQLRDALMEMIPAEQDWGNRMYLTGALSNACEVGDTEVADFFEALAEFEPHWLTVKPTMQYLAHYLRTGEDDRARIPPPNPGSSSSE